jgi:hypothetical protein
LVIHIKQSLQKITDVHVLVLVGQPIVVEKFGRTIKDGVALLRSFGQLEFFGAATIVLAEFEQVIPIGVVLQRYRVSDDDHQRFGAGYGYIEALEK